MRVSLSHGLKLRVKIKIACDQPAMHGLSIYGYVSAAGTVTVEVCAIVATTPNSVTYNIRVIQ
jgi:hypothetical protein